MAEQEQEKPAFVFKRGDKFKLGDRVKIRLSGGLRGPIVELRGPLGPGGAQIYRVQVGRKPEPSYIEVRKDQLVLAPIKPKPGDEAGPMAEHEQKKPASVSKRRAKFLLGEWVKIRDSGGRAGRIVELRGPLGPEGAQIYRVRVGRKPDFSYLELREDQLEGAPINDMSADEVRAMLKRERENPTLRFKLGDRVKIRHSGGMRGRIVEWRGPLGPKGEHIYRVILRRKPEPAYTEVREDQLVLIPPKS
jgi:hypothetical protein